MDNVHVAVLLALSSALCIAIGDVLQQNATHRVTDRPVGYLALLTRLLRDPRWRWGGLTLAASVALQAAALGVGSVLLVQPLLVCSLLFALPINAWMAPPGQCSVSSFSTKRWTPVATA